MSLVVNATSIKLTKTRKIKTGGPKCWF